VEHHGKNPSKIVVAIIPARYASVRLPGKLLLPIAGLPLIAHTIERAKSASTISRVVVATDDQRIFDAVDGLGAEVVMTSPEHRSGTDRLAEVASSLPKDSIIVNVQGDEPMIAPETIDSAVQALIDDPDAHMTTTSEAIESIEDLLNGNIVKVVTGDAGYALYFSRSPMPFPRDAALKYDGDPNRAIREEPRLLSLFRKHTGLYVYRRDYLLRLSKLSPTHLEQVEMLEQLRALDDGAKIRVIEAASSSIGVDTQEDYEKVRQLLESRAAVVQGS